MAEEVKNTDSQATLFTTYYRLIRYKMMVEMTYSDIHYSLLRQGISTAVTVTGPG